MNFIVLSIDAALGVACLVGYAIEKRRAREWYALASSKNAPVSPEVLEVRVDGASGAKVNLGSSDEKYDAMSASPTLKSEEVALVAKDGRRLVVPPGQTFR